MKRLLYLFPLTSSAADLVSPPAVESASRWPLFVVIAAIGAIAIYAFVWPKIRDTLKAQPQPVTNRVDPSLGTQPPPQPAPVAQPAPVTQPLPITPAPGMGGFPAPLSGEGIEQYMQRAGINLGTYLWQMRAEAAQHPGHGWDEIADRVMHPEHYYTPADLDTIAAAQRANVDTVYPEVPGQTVPASVLVTDDDLKALYQLSAKWGNNWPFRHVSGTQSQINALLAKYANEPAAANVDLASYNGALKPVMDLP